MGAALHARRLAAVPDLSALAAARPGRYPLLLESAAHGTARARHDLLLALPDGGIVLDADGLRTLDGTALRGSFLEALDRAFAAERSDTASTPALPFIGGWALLLGYELAGEIEPTLRLPPAPSGPPTALALRCRAAVVVDHAAASAWLVAESAEGLELLHADASAPEARQAVAAPGRSQTGMFAREGYRDVLVPGPGAATACRAPAPWPGIPAFLVEEDDPVRFLDGVHRILDWLAAGDAFQVNLSRAWRARPQGPLQPAALYQALRRANPAPFAGLFQHRNWAIASSSPERLLAVDGDRIETRPIAGTRARSDDPALDRARIEELVAHPKERAEHVMLIDLERNDLGRVCVPGSVVVEELMAVESYRHVHHIESTVAGRLRPGTGPGAAIRAVFPGGTITGCPKVRCMEIIAALEGEGRGAYTGAMGYLSRDGRMDLNILIRTLVWDGSEVRLRAGAGIVADSDPQAELAETRAKARGLLAALAVEHGGQP